MQLNKTKEKTIEEINEELKLKKITHPFDDDLLNLKPFAETISNIVVSTQDPFVFSINSPYGTGKTFLLRRLHCLLEQKGCMCVSYNAWESDFYDNPLIAIISELIDTLKSNSKDFKNIEKEGIELSSISIGFSFLFNTDISLQQKENFLNLYKKYKDLKYKFISALQNFTKELKKPLVFIVDELDRCRPDYAIKTLEVIKHFFNIDNIVFIIGVDRKQIESTVKVLYGSNIDNNCDEYLRKFIDQDFYLPHNYIEQYISVLCKKYLTQSLTGFIEEYIKDYLLHWESTKIYSILNLNKIVSIPNSVDSLLKSVVEIIVEYVSALSEFFNFSLRKQEQFILFLKLFFQSLDIKKDFLYPELACILTAIRLNDYNDILSDDATIFNLIFPFAINAKINEQRAKNFLKKFDGKINRNKINSIIEKTRPIEERHITNSIIDTEKTRPIGGRYITNSIDIWQKLYFNDNIHHISGEFVTHIISNISKDNIEKYRTTIKHLTILTTENK